MNPKKIRGIVVPLVTPLTADERLDLDGLASLVEHVVTGGVHGIFILGTTGEGPNLSYAVRRDLIRESARLVGDRVPLYVGVTDTAFEESVQLGRLAADVGADAAVFAPPYYFPLEGADLFHYTEAMVRSLPLPSILYNMPSMTKTAFPVELLKRFVESGRVVGIKDSSGDIGYYSEVCALSRGSDEVSTLIGPEALLIPSIALGGDGGVSGGANVFPEVFVQAFNCAVSGDEAACRVAQAKIDAIGHVYAAGHGAGRYISTTKYALECLGICGGDSTRSFEPLREEGKASIRRFVEAISGVSAAS
jgi:4-hydroxy-tetrahydrodipicolinate synthase